MKRPRPLRAARSALGRPSGWVLLAVNLGLLIAVVAWDWNVFDIVFLYWAENLVIGVLNVVRMLVAGTTPAAGLLVGPSQAPERQMLQSAVIANRAVRLILTLFLVPFFIIHYGMFCYGHGVFVFALLDGGAPADDNLLAAARSVMTTPLAVSLALLAASHAFSLVFNFLLKGEYRRTNAAALMMRPYGRIVVLHLTILLGGFLVMAFDSPLWMLVVLVVLKTVVDLGLHDRERVKLGPGDERAAGGL